MAFHGVKEMAEIKKLEASNQSYKKLKNE